MSFEKMIKISYTNEFINYYYITYIKIIYKISKILFKIFEIENRVKKDIDKIVYCFYCIYEYIYIKSF